MQEKSQQIDIAVVGAGGAGLTAGLAAAEQGASARVFEASGLVGGTYAYSAGQVWAAGTRQEREAGIDDTVEDGIAHARRLSAGRHDEGILHTYMTELPAVLEWLAGSHGFDHELLRGFPDYYAELEGGRLEGRYLAPLPFNRNDLPVEWRDRLVRGPMYADVPARYSEVVTWGGFGRAFEWDWDMLRERAAAGFVGFGTATAGYLLSAALRAGVTVSLEHRLSALRPVDDGWELTFETPDGALEVRASAVILCTGGYEASRERQAEFDFGPAVPAAGSPWVDGHPIRLALEQGAAFADVAGQLVLPTLEIPGEQYQGEQVRRLATRELGLPGGLAVNSRGERYADESFYRDLVAEMVRLDGVSQMYPNLRTHLIIDEQARDRYALGPLAPGEKPEWLISADSPRELAAAIGVDAETLSRTIERFNEGAARGVDPDFGRGERAFGRVNGDRDHAPNPNLRPLSGRLFAVPIVAASVGSSGGLRFDSDGRVLDWGGRALPGLYCAGNAGAGLVEGQWYNSGIANGRGLLFGYRAARDAAGRTRSA